MVTEGLNSETFKTRHPDRPRPARAKHQRSFTTLASKGRAFAPQSPWQPAGRNHHSLYPVESLPGGWDPAKALADREVRVQNDTDGLNGGVRSASLTSARCIFHSAFSRPPSSSVSSQALGESPGFLGLVERTLVRPLSPHALRGGSDFTRTALKDRFSRIQLRTRNLTGRGSTGECWHEGQIP